MKNPRDKFMDYLERYSIITLITLITVLLGINKGLLMITKNKGWLSLDNFISGPLKTALMQKDGTLITIAAVFIGIYFTVFSLLSSIKIESTFAILTNKNFEKLLRFIKNAFIGSFSYLFFSIISPTLKNDWIVSVITIVLLLYMLLSALRFGVIIYFIFKNDVKKFHENLDLEKQQKRKQEVLFHRLERFLNEYEDERERTRAKEVLKMLDERKNSPK
ncbi:hypothetical protein [Cytobacillus firmus]|uniref:hypothetical protein n=1 Tax=Cytobacillus firmus TaxID=1399 RepID=UPI00222820B5|nr:hypothetical protein [Cytobacillus firmus]